MSGRIVDSFVSFLTEEVNESATIFVSKVNELKTPASLETSDLSEDSLN
jgi:hypothetical protein